MARATRELVYIGIKGYVVALDRGTGAEAWRTHLKGSGFVNVTLERGVVLAGTRGEAFALDPGTGRTLWTNRLKGFGHGIIAFASAGSAAAVAQLEADAAAESGATTAAVVASTSSA